MRHLIHFIIILFVTNISVGVYGQPIGISAILPKELPKTTILIEKRIASKIESYVPLKERKLNPEFKVDDGELSDLNVYVKIKKLNYEYRPLGSGVLIIYSGKVFIVTAEHVIPTDGDVYFRFPQKTTQDSIHRSHIELKNNIGLDWVRDKENDLAITLVGYGETDDIKAIDIEKFSVEYKDVSIGDDVYVIGYPSSVVFSQDPAIHFIRNGVISSKLPNGHIIIDSLLFPGNSGGPVYWKPSLGLEFKGMLQGPSIPARESKLIGIVSQTLSYREEAKSVQTDRTRIIFEDNSGLSIIISATKIIDLLRSEEISSAIKRIDKGITDKNPK